ncbi:MAG: DUF1003 domain-containing protein [Acidobacteriota bacterium]|nr:DUF1003 domain-containing protein [Acidobacteriota bacterium]
MIEKSDTNTNSESDDYHNPATVEELTEQNVETIVRLENAAKESQTTSERIAEVIANFCGSMTFVWVHVLWFGVWVLVNTLPGVEPFDPFPFTFLTLVVSLEAIFLSTFILISQNQETRITERRNNLDLQINLLTEQENTKMLQILERIAEKVGVVIDDDPTVSILEQATRPEKLVEQITQATEQKEVMKKAAEESVLNLTSTD